MLVYRTADRPLVWAAEVYREHRCLKLQVVVSRFVSLINPSDSLPCAHQSVTCVNYLQCIGSPSQGHIGLKSVQTFTPIVSIHLSRKRLEQPEEIREYPYLDDLKKTDDVLCWFPDFFSWNCCSSFCSVHCCTYMSEVVGCDTPSLIPPFLKTLEKLQKLQWPSQTRNSFSE